MDFLVDTGSSVSVIPYRINAGLSLPFSGEFLAANGTTIKSAGVERITFTLPHASTLFTWKFFIAEVRQPIIGADFLTHHNLLVDCNNKRLIPQGKHPFEPHNKKTQPQQINQASNSTLPKHNSATQHVKRHPLFANLSQPNAPTFLLTLENFIREFCPNTFHRNTEHVKGLATEHQIITPATQPIRQRRRELDPERRELAESEFLELESAGIIRRSTSQWASPLHIVQKKDGSIRPCGDYRLLNNVTLHDSYPLPLIADILHRLDGSTIFSTIDLHKAYHQIPVANEDIPKTAITTPFGLFEYLFMPFGLRNAAQTFQRHIDTVLSGLHFATAYIDDILIASANEREHLDHLKTLFQRLHNNNLLVNWEKCTIASSRVKFLGHLISDQGHTPLPERVQVIKSIPLPTTVTELRSFLGTVNFCHRYIPHCSTLTSQLSALCAGPKRSKITWTAELQADFEKLKHKLENLRILSYPKKGAELYLSTDASSTAAGAVLHQLVNDTHQPIEFFSIKFNAAEQRYSTFDRELLSIVLAVKHFRHFLQGRKFIVRSDHKPLVHIMGMKDPSPRQQRQISFLSEFNMSIVYLPGEENSVADFLSRSVNNIYFPPVFTKERLSSFPITQEDLSYFKETVFSNGITYDTSLSGTLRPILSKDLRKEAFNRIHDLHHPGSTNTYKLLKSRVIWPHMRQDVKTWTSQCTLCQRYKTIRKVTPPITHYPTTSRFETVHIDLVGPLPSDRGFEYVFTMLDRASRWQEAVPVKNLCSETICRIFLSTWICRFGAPRYVITDQGRQFESGVFKTMIDKLGAKHVHTSAYHPQANGAIERFHRTFKTSLKILADKNAHWVDSVPYVLLGWRNTPNTATDASPAQILYGTSIRFLSELTDCNVTPSDTDIAAARKLFESLPKDKFYQMPNHAKTFLPESLYNTKFLWLKDHTSNGFKPPYTGPYKIIELYPSNAKILKDGKIITVHLNNTKPAFVVDDTPIPDSDNRTSFLSDMLEMTVSDKPLITTTPTPSEGASGNTATNSTTPRIEDNSNQTSPDDVVTNQRNSRIRPARFTSWVPVQTPTGITRLRRVEQ
jgi:cleavage and polyadenylation specificity factor subunit 1